MIRDLSPRLRPASLAAAGALAGLLALACAPVVLDSLAPDPRGADRPARAAAASDPARARPAADPQGSPAGQRARASAPPPPRAGELRGVWRAAATTPALGPAARAPDALAALTRAAGSSAAQARARAAAGLTSRLGNPRARGALGRLLEDPVPWVAVAAARALAAAPSGSELLIARLRGEPGLVALACLEALARCGQPEHLASLLPWVRNAGAAGEAATWAIQEICRRAGTSPPVGLPDVPDGDEAARWGSFSPAGSPLAPVETPWR
ncbi:MAG: hypothetical protein AB7N76_08215 [Planctomycetota bacterium]